MPLQALRTVAKAQNGVGSFILQCKRLDMFYCDWSGSSKGMNAFLQHRLADFAKQNPGIEISVSPRPGRHPVLRAQYINGRAKAVCVRNLAPQQVLQKALLLRDASGEKLRRAATRPVRSANEGVRGVWSPHHGEPFKI